MPPTHYKYPKNKKYQFRKRRKSPDATDDYSGIPLPKNHELRFIKLTSLALTTFLITFLSISILTPTQPSSAEELLLANQAIGNTVSLSTSAEPINLSITSTPDGTVRTVSDAVSVTSSSTGYQLYISAASAEVALVRDNSDSTNSINLIPSITSGGKAVPISSPISLTANTWGFAATGADVVNAAGFDDAYGTEESSNASNKFASLPARGNDVLIAKREAEANAVPTTFYYGANVTSSKPSGLYKNTIVYTAISGSTTSNMATVSPASILYNSKASIEISTPSTATASSAGTITVTVGGEECVAPVATKNEAYLNITCAAPVLATGWHEVVVNLEGVSETYVVNPGLEYYMEPSTIPAMQDFTLADCAVISPNNKIILRDSRDDNAYTVSKLPDGNCWMTTNLMLGNTITEEGSIEINSSNTDTDLTFTIMSGDITYAGHTGNWSSNDYDKLHIYARQATETDGNGNPYGNLYNWYTATATTGTQSGVTSGDAGGSLCPKGWKLPPNTGNGSYTNLFQMSTVVGGMGLTATSGTDTANFGANATVTKSPYSFPLAGYWESGGLDRVDAWGIYWSRTYSSNSGRAYNFYFVGDGRFWLQNDYYKYSGESVRCVFQATMQDFTSTMCSNLKTAETLTLADARDGNRYTVTKLPDQNCWMTTNLMLGNTITNSGSITIDSANSQVASGTFFQISSGNVMASGKTNNWTSNDYDKLHVYARAASEKDANGNIYGNLYNWFTATAQSGTQSMTSGDAAYSICPKGWRLPSNTGNPSYTNLFQTSSSNGGMGLTTTSGTDTTNFGASAVVAKAPYSFPLAGRWSDGSLDYVGNDGRYWSRAAINTLDTYYFQFNSNGSFSFQFSNRKYVGLSVRCVFSG